MLLIENDNQETRPNYKYNEEDEMNPADISKTSMFNAYMVNPLCGAQHRVWDFDV